MDQKTDFCNVPKSIEDKIGRNLHKQKNHPIEIIKRQILGYFTGLKEYKFNVFEDLSPYVSVVENFDKLLIKKDHPSRSKSDTYYINENMVLRTHTSAHQNELLARGHTSFIVVGDVYRKDEIDKCHYPVFHQMELLTLVEDRVNPVDELKIILSGLVEHLFPGCTFRFNPDYFPFTDPSFEVEVMYMGNWLEILGCGVVQDEILRNNGIQGKKAIALGLGIERLAMIFFQIPDIRYIWSTHEKFLDQFASGNIVQFKPYSELPSQVRDISFYIQDNSLDKDNKWIYENDFFEYIRCMSGELMEEVTLLSTFYNQKINKHSRAYRMTYSPNDPKYKNPAEFTTLVNEIQKEIRDGIEAKLGIKLR